MLTFVIEDAILKKIESWCADTHLSSTMLGVGDDAAAVFPSGRPLFFCSDFSIENTHFDLRFSMAADVGHKSLVRPLSDIAAMNAEALGVTISVATPRAWTTSHSESFLEGFFMGAADAARTYRAPLLGGDLSRTDGSLVVDVAAIGQLRPRGTVWRRSGARPRDLAFVTGPLGRASFALSELRGGRRDQLANDILEKHLRPVPRFDIGERLGTFPISAAIDLSDGLVRDATRMCEASFVSLELRAQDIPGIKSYGTAHALSGGDDYELLIAVSPDWAQSSEGREQLEKANAIAVGEFQSTTAGDGPMVYLAENANQRISATEFLLASHDPFRDTHGK